ncbi:MAG: hypothetical protein FJ137_16825 [Deltaproteobacteria bacterium]|nr:hypothetical protein [Deltaproteobacteria bacterium]
MSLRAVCFALSASALAACATPPAPPPPAPPPLPVAPPATEPADTDDDAPEAEGADAPPASWAAALDRYGTSCPAPFFTLATPESRALGGAGFRLHGSRLEYLGPAPKGPLAIGVLGSVKDATPETRANLAVAAREFQRAGVAFVVVNGDLVGETSDSLAPVVDALGETFAVPVLVHSGNSEWTSAFSESVNGAAARWPQIVNMNLIRDVDWAGVHVVSLPGYHDRRFLRQGACHYSADDVDATAAWVKALHDRGDVVVLTAHGPPRGRGKHALDVIHDGDNVGDEQLSSMLRGGVAFGVFSHILESGGRVLDDVDAPAGVALPMKAPKKKLYVNVGAATSFGWSMVDGKTSRGMAAILRVQKNADGADAMVEVVKLR